MTKTMEQVKNKVDLEYLIRKGNINQIEKELEINQNHNMNDALSFIYTLQSSKVKNSYSTSLDENFIIQLIDLFLKNGADINNDNGSMLRSWSGMPSIKIINHLLQNGANINAKSFRENALTSAINYEQMETVKLLIEKGANIHDDEINLLALCTNNGNIDMLKYLISIGCNKQENKDTALINGIYVPNIEILDFLIKEGANIHTHNDEVICIASRYENLDVINFLIKNNVDVTAQNNQPLKNAIENDNEDNVKILIQHGADVNVAIKEYLYTQNEDLLKWCSNFKDRKKLEIKLNKELMSHDTIKRIKI